MSIPSPTSSFTCSLPTNELPVPLAGSAVPELRYAAQKLGEETLTAGRRQSVLLAARDALASIAVRLAQSRPAPAWQADERVCRVGGAANQLYQYRVYDDYFLTSRRPMSAIELLAEVCHESAITLSMLAACPLDQGHVHDALVSMTLMVDTVSAAVEPAVLALGAGVAETERFIDDLLAYLVPFGSSVSPVAIWKHGHHSYALANQFAASAIRHAVAALTEGRRGDAA